MPVEGNFDLASSKIVLGEGAPLVGWPVLGYAHLLVCDDPADPLGLSFAQYVVRLAGQGALETYGVTPLPEPIRIQTFAPLKVTVQLNEDGTLPSAAPSADASAEPAADASAEPVRRVVPRPLTPSAECVAAARFPPGKRAATHALGTDEGPPPCGGGPSFLCGEVR